MGEAPVVDRLQRREVARLRVGVVHQRVQHRRHQHRRGDLLLLDGLEHQRGVESREHDHRAALDQRRREERGTGVRAACIRNRGRCGHSHSASWICVIVDIARAVPITPFGLARRATGVGDRDDVVGCQARGLQRLRAERGGRRNNVGADLGELGRDGPQGEDLLESGHLLQQFDSPLDELGYRVDDQRRYTGVVEDIGVVVGRAQRMQRGPPVPPGSGRRRSPAALRAVQRQEPDCGTTAGTDGLESLDVGADGIGHLGTGQLDVTQVQDPTVGVAVKGCDEEVAEMCVAAQQVDFSHRSRLGRVLVLRKCNPTMSCSQPPLGLVTN